jgi:hypothetical protein
MPVVIENNKSIAQIVAELKNDARDFISTRLQMLAQEMKSKANVWKAAIPLLAFAALLGATAFLCLTFCFVSLFAGVFEPGQYAWAWGALIVTGVYLVAAFGLFYLGRRVLTQAGVVPQRTLRVLKEDQIWMQNEARSQV